MVQDLYVLMITAAVVSILFKLLKQPVVLGYIVAGVLVAAAETTARSTDNHAFEDRVRHSVRNTFITKRLVGLFFKNMSAKDENHEE